MNPENQLIKVEEFTTILQTAPDAIATNKNSVARCNDAGKTLLDTIEAIGEIDNDELDAKVAEFIEKAKITVKKMNDRRSPLTQLLTRISKEFTTLENEINPTNKDSSAGLLQVYRNNYAAKKLAEIRKKEEEARKLRKAEEEKKNYRSHLILGLEEHYSKYFNHCSKQLISLYDNITLESFDSSAEQINVFSTVYPVNEEFSKFSDNFYAVHITNEDKTTIKKEIIPGIMKSCVEKYANEISEIKDSLLIKLPARKRELEQIEELRKQDTEAAKRAETAAEERAKEEERKREEERKKQEAEAKTKAEASAQQADIFSYFNAVAAEIPTTTPNANVTKKIIINNAKGFMEVYKLWFLGEGINMSLEELEKIHKKFITFAEKTANKEKEFIKSPFVEYIDDVKAK